jgi:hypothetical protein
MSALRGLRSAPVAARPTAVVLAAAALLAVAGPAAAQEAVAPEPPAAADAADPEPPCAAPEFRQLDFWVGTWDLTWEGGSGTNVIDRPYGDCVIRERFDGGDFRGMSVSTWDPLAGVWKQTWVDNRGGYMDFTGGPDGDRMILSRVLVTDAGEVHQRMVFRDIIEDSLTWDWERSLNGGQTWELRWRIQYRRRPG